MKNRLQRMASRVWPVTLLLLVVVAPYLVVKSYREFKGK